MRLLVVRERLDCSQRTDRGSHQQPGSRPQVRVRSSLVDDRKPPLRLRSGTRSFRRRARRTSTHSTRRRGKQLWKTRVDSHFVARITAGTKYYNGKLFVPVSSSEEFNSGNPGYSCCTARGSVVALDANTGKQLWKAWVIPDEPRPYKTMANGVALYRPAGGAVWNSPTVDPVRNAIYFGTGDATTSPSPTTTDGVMAVDIDTGKLLWSYQATDE